MKEKECKWELEDNGMDRYYKTECGEEFFVMDDDLEENNFWYCPACGGKIINTTK